MDLYYMLGLFSFPNFNDLCRKKQILPTGQNEIIKSGQVKNDLHLFPFKMYSERTIIGTINLIDVRNLFSSHCRKSGFSSDSFLPRIPGKLQRFPGMCIWSKIGTFQIQCKSASSPLPTLYVLTTIENFEQVSFLYPKYSSYLSFLH